VITISNTTICGSSKLINGTASARETLFHKINLKRKPSMGQKKDRFKRVVIR
jgi:hypothetical protein